MKTVRQELSRRAFLRLGAVTAGGLALAACAPAPPPAPAAPAPTEAPKAEVPTEAPAAPAEPTPSVSRPGVLTAWSMSFQPHAWMMQAIVPDFQAQNPDITVDYQPQPGDYGAKWRAALAANQAPDIFIIHGSALLELAVAGQLMPVTPDIATVEEIKKDFMPENYLQSFYKGNIYAYGVPDPPGDAGMVVNLDFMDEAGLKPLPVFDSTDQMLEYARKLVVKNGDEVQRAGVMITGEGNFPIYWLSYIIDMGGRWFDNDKQLFTLQTPEAEAALQFFYDIIWKERLDDPALGNNMFNAIPQGLAAMAYMWPEFVPYATAAFPDLRLGLTIKPGFTPGKPAIFNHSDTWNFAVWSGTKNKESAIKFLQYGKQKDVQHKMLEQNPGMSPLKAITFDKTDPFCRTAKAPKMPP
jgi:multiple sugar transport system substrate-binding protein